MYIGLQNDDISFMVSFLINELINSMGTFVITRRFNDEYKFVFASRKGKTIFTSLSFELNFECDESIQRFKSGIEHCSYVRHKSSNGKYYFKVLLDDELFAVSRKYTTELRVLKAIQEIKNYASKAEVLDFSANDFVFE